MVKGLRHLKSYAGKAIKVYLKDGGAFHFKVIEASDHHIGGFDDEGVDLRIEAGDIDFIID